MLKLKKRQIYALVGVIAVLLLSWLGPALLRRLGILNPNAPSGASTYDERQARALRPQFASDLDRVALAPHYTLTATVDMENGAVNGEMDVHLTNRTDDVMTSLVFRLYPNADAVYGGGSLTVDRIVQGAAALDTSLSEDRTVVRAELETPLQPDAATTVAVTFAAEVPQSLAQGYGIFAEARGLLSLAGWYPILAPYETGAGWQTPAVPIVGDAMLAETSLYEVSLTVPADHRVVATGSLIDRETDGDRTTWRWVSGPAREFAAAVSDRFNTVEVTVDGVDLRVHTLPAVGPVTPPREALGMAEAVFSAYVEAYGPYRFEELDIVHAVVPIGGYEFPGMVYVEEAKRTTSSRAEYEYLLAHEIAHQWWYAQVGSHTVNAPWLDEGMATYSIALYRNRAPQSTGSGDALLRYWRRSYGARQSYDPPINTPALDFAGWGPYRQTVYIHGALFIDELRRAMGDEAFFAFLEDFAEDHRYQIVDTGTFLDAAQAASEADLTPVFETWFDLERAAPNS